jgi:inner membrane protein
MIMLAYIGLNLAESAYVERATADALRSRGIEPTLVVAGPPPLAFWKRTIEWRSANHFGSGEFSPASGVRLNSNIQPLGLDDPQLALAESTQRHVRSFLVWSRMPIVVRIDGRSYLTDQRFYGASSRIRTTAFLIPLDKR